MASRVLLSMFRPLDSTDMALLALLLLPVLAWAWWRFRHEDDAFATLSVGGLLVISLVVAAVGWALLR